MRCIRGGGGGVCWGRRRCVGEEGGGDYNRLGPQHRQHKIIMCLKSFPQETWLPQFQGGSNQAS